MENTKETTKKVSGNTKVITTMMGTTKVTIRSNEPSEKAINDFNNAVNLIFK